MTDYRLELYSFEGDLLHTISSPTSVCRIAVENPSWGQGTFVGWGPTNTSPSEECIGSNSYITLVEPVTKLYAVWSCVINFTYNSGNSVLYDRGYVCTVPQITGLRGTVYRFPELARHPRESRMIVGSLKEAPYRTIRTRNIVTYQTYWKSRTGTQNMFEPGEEAVIQGNEAYVAQSTEIESAPEYYVTYALVAEYDSVGGTPFSLYNVTWEAIEYGAIKGGATWDAIEHGAWSVSTTNDMITQYCITEEYGPFSSIEEINQASLPSVSLGVIPDIYKNKRKLNGWTNALEEGVYPVSQKITFAADWYGAVELYVDLMGGTPASDGVLKELYRAILDPDTLTAYSDYHAGNNRITLFIPENESLQIALADDFADVFDKKITLAGRYLAGYVVSNNPIPADSTATFTLVWDNYCIFKITHSEGGKITPVDTVTVRKNTPYHVESNMIYIGDRTLIAKASEENADRKYKFKSWNVTEGTITSDMSAYAEFELQSPHILKLFTFEGDLTYTYAVYDDAESVTRTLSYANPTWVNGTFVGWGATNTTEEGAIRYGYTYSLPLGETSRYAVWRCTLTFSYAGYNCSVPFITGIRGTECTLPDLTKDDYNRDDYSGELDSGQYYRDRDHTLIEYDAYWKDAGKPGSRYLISRNITIPAAANEKVTMTYFRTYGLVVEYDASGGEVAESVQKYASDEYGPFATKDLRNRQAVPDLTINFPAATKAYRIFYRWQGPQDQHLSGDTPAYRAAQKIQIIALWLAKLRVEYDLGSRDAVITDWNTLSELTRIAVNSLGTNYGYYESAPGRITNYVLEGTTVDISAPTLTKESSDTLGRTDFYVAGLNSNKSTLTAPSLASVAEEYAIITVSWGQYIQEINYWTYAGTSQKYELHRGADRIATDALEVPRNHMAWPMWTERPAEAEWKGWVRDRPDMVGKCGVSSAEEIRPYLDTYHIVCPAYEVEVTSEFPKYAPELEGLASNVFDVIQMYSCWYQYYHLITFDQNGKVWTNAEARVRWGLNESLSVMFDTNEPRNEQYWFRGFKKGSEYVLFRAYTCYTEDLNVVDIRYFPQQHDDEVPLDEGVADLGRCSYTVAGDSKETLSIIGIQFRYTLEYRAVPRTGDGWVLNGALLGTHKGETQTHNMPGFRSVGLESNPGNWWTIPSGALQVEGAPCFRGWWTVTDTSAFREGETTVIKGVPTDKSETAVSKVLYAKYLYEFDLYQCIVEYILQNASHHPLDVVSALLPGNKGPQMLGTVADYSRKDFEYGTKNGVPVYREKYHTESAMTKIPELMTKADLYPYQDIQEYSFQGWFKTASVPNDSSSVITGSRTNIIPTYRGQDATVTVYGVWYRRLTVELRMEYKNEYYTSSGYSDGYYGTVLGRPQLPKNMGIVTKVWSRTDITNEYGEKIDNVTYTYTGVMIGEGSKAVKYAFGTDYATKYEDISAFKTVIPAVLAMSAEPTVRLNARISESASDNLLGDHPYDLSQPLDFFFGSATQISKTLLNNILLKDYPDTYKYDVGAWTVTNTDTKQELSVGYGAPITVEPTRGCEDYSVFMTYAPATYQVYVHTKLTDEDNVSWEWVTPFTVRYGEGASPAITTVEIREKILANSDYTALEKSKADLLLNYSIMALATARGLEIEGAVSETYDAFSSDGKDVEVYAVRGALPTSLAWSEQYRSEQNRVILTPVMQFPAGGYGDNRVEVYCTIDGTVVPPTLYGGIAGSVSIAPGMHNLEGRAYANPNLKTVPALRAHCGILHFVQERIEGDNETIRFSCPADQYKIDFNDIYTDLDLGGYTAHSSAGWENAGWSTNGARVRTVRFSQTVDEITVRPLWEVRVIFRIGNSAELYRENEKCESKDFILGAITAEETLTLDLEKYTIRHPLLVLAGWMVDGVRTGTIPSLKPGTHVVEAFYRNPALNVYWANFGVKAEEVSITDESAQKYLLTTRYSANWPTTKTEGSDISFNYSNRPAEMKGAIYAETTLERTPVDVYEGGVLVFTTYMTHSDGEYLKFTLNTNEIPRLVLDRVGGAVITEWDEEKRYGEHDMIKARSGVYRKVDGRYELYPINEVLLGGLTANNNMYYKAGEKIEVEAVFDGYPVEIRSDLSRNISFLGYDRADAGNWVIVSNSEEVTLDVNLKEKPSAARVYKILQNAQGTTYFSEIFITAIKTTIEKVSWSVDTQEEDRYGVVRLLARAPAGKYAVIFTVFGTEGSDPIEKAYLVLLEVTDKFSTGPLCVISKYAKSNLTVPTDTVYLSKPGSPNVSITSVTRQFTSKLTTIPILTKNSEFNYCIDLGTKESVNMAVTRTEVTHPDDESIDETRWSNRKWIHHVKSFFDEWQNLNYDSSGKRAGGYEMVYDPNSESAMPVIHKNVFLAGALEYVYSRAIVNLQFKFVVASMLGRDAQNIGAHKVYYYYVEQLADGKTAAVKKEMVYYRDVFTTMSIPGSAVAGQVGWMEYDIGLSADQLSEYDSSTRIIPMGGNGMGFYPPDEEIPTSLAENTSGRSESSRYFYAYTGKRLRALVLTDPGLSYVHLADLINGYREKDHILKITLIGGGGSGGNSLVDMSETLASSKRDKMRDGLLNGKYDMKSGSKLGGGGAGGACVVRCYDMNGLWAGDNAVPFKIVIGEGGSKGGNDGGETSVMYIGAKGANIEAKASGGRGGSLDGYGEAGPGALQYSGGENNFIQDRSTFGDGKWIGKAGHPDLKFGAHGGNGTKDTIVDGKYLLPSCGGGAANVYLEKGSDEVWFEKISSSSIGGVTDAELGGIGANDDNKFKYDGEKWKIKSAIKIPNGSSVTINLGNVPDNAWGAAIPALNKEEVHGLKIVDTQVYENGAWRSVRDGELILPDSKGKNVGKYTNYKFNDYLQIKGPIFGAEKWYRILWQYYTTSISNAIGGIAKGTSKVYHYRAFVFQLTKGCIQVTEGRKLCGNGAGYINEYSGNFAKFQEAAYGGGGASRILHSTALTEMSVSGHNLTFKGSAGAPGAVIFEVINVREDK